MIKVEPIQSIMVDIDGKEVKIYRDEVMRNPKLRDYLTSFERVLEEIAVIEYERDKLLHAKFSMQARINAETHKYIVERDGTDNTDGS